MHTPFPLFLALKYLKPKRSVASVVTFVSIVGVMFGVAIVIIVRAVMTGFGDTWKGKILDFKPHITLVRGGEFRPIDNEMELCARLEQIPGVTAALPSIVARVLVEHNRRVLAPLLTGTDPGRLPHLMRQEYIVSGAFDLEGDAAIIGTGMARQLGLRVGDELLVYSPMNLVDKDEVYFPERLEVTGLYESGKYDYDSGYVITSLAVARDLMGMKKGGAYAIHLKTVDPQNMAVFNRVVRDVEALCPGYVAQTWLEIDRELFTAIATEKNMMVILLMFITIVAIFCVMNTLIVLTVQKTNEIGLLKALGFSSWQVMLTFVLHGWIQCFAGTLLGIAAALAVLRNLQNLVAFLGRCGVDVFQPSIYGLSEIPWRVVPSEIVIVAGMVVVFCTIASVFPAWRAARMDPVAALRKE